MLQRASSFLKQFRSDIPKGEYIRLFLSILFYFSTSFLLANFYVISDRRLSYQTLPEHAIHFPLRDLVFESFPLIRDPNIAHLLVSTFFLLAFVGNLFFNICLWLESLIVARRFFWIAAWLSLFQAATMIVTTVPSPPLLVSPQSCSSAHAVAVVEPGWDSVVTALKVMFWMEKTCTAAIISGQTMLIVVCLMFWYIYAKYWVFIIYALVHAIGAIVVSSLAHLQYTTSTLLGVFVAYLFISLYLHNVYCAVELRLNKLRTLNDADEVETKTLIKTMVVKRFANLHLPAIIGWMDGVDLRVN
ncbi:hypothetical protein GQ42DRAFT_171212 [Ramicandelaber brevisporus]|nr:hypothetical protein GQ42DRAFT_171212 [Ramicandelaber brevisporus]